MIRCSYIKVLIALSFTVLSCQSYATKISLDKLDSITPILESGRFRIMVEFSEDTNSSANSRASITKVSRQADKDAHLRQLLKRKSNNTENMRGRYIRPNLRTLTVSKAELEKLVMHEEIRVYEDRLHKPSLASSIDVIFPNQATSAFSGNGQAVAILDTGVNKNHSFLSGSVIDAAEACFSTEDSNQSFESLCPNNQESMIGSGAAAACDSSIPGCSHGTQMTGVIAGEGTSFNGVATSTTIIPVQVYSLSNDEIVCSFVGALPPCVGALTSDIISGLDYIDSIKNSYSIAAVNISAGSTIAYQGQCDGNEPAEYVSAVADLTSSGIAVIASSGNDALANEMSSPACLSDVISVAATDDSDVPWSLNNRNSELNFFAPGVSVTTSSLPNNSFSTNSGTSIAAAHVSGAWAVMKSKSPNATVASIKNILTNTGKLVTQGLFTKPRINLTEAVGETIVNDTSFLPAVYLLLLGDD